MSSIVGIVKPPHGGRNTLLKPTLQRDHSSKSEVSDNEDGDTIDEQLARAKQESCALLKRMKVLKERYDTNTVRIEKLESEKKEMEVDKEGLFSFLDDMGDESGDVPGESEL